jgi:hypothetical protein
MQRGNGDAGTDEENMNSNEQQRMREKTSHRQSRLLAKLATIARKQQNDR